MCEYEYENGEKCHREALENSEKGYCLLHEDWDKKDEEETREQFYKGIEEGETNFDGCILPKFDLSKKTIKGHLSFIKTTIVGYSSFTGAAIEGDVVFTGASIEGDFWFNGVTVEGIAWFEGVTIEGDARFTGMIVKGIKWFRPLKEETLLFEGIRIKGNIWFEGAIIAENAWFDKAIIEGNTLFTGVTIEKDASFIGATIKGGAQFNFENVQFLSFKDAMFSSMYSQENACREAKIVNERRGDRVLADYHFYREMEAKRKQKHPVIKILECPVQYIFGYGVYPFRTIITWFSIVLGIFPFVYWLFGGVKGAETLGQCYYFSIVTATTLGYGDYQPNPGLFHSLASIEAIFGTLMWAAFIAIFARKYMR